MTARRFPTHEAEERLRARRDAGATVVPLHGTPAPALPAHVVEAVAAALSSASPAPHPRGLPELRGRLATAVAAGTGRAVDQGRELVVTNGAMHALGLCFRSLLGPGDEVVVPSPCFFFDGPIRSAGGVPVYVPSSAEQGWAWDADEVEAAVGSRARALLLCNPGNPTGRVPGADEVRAVVEAAVRHGLVVVTDEAYEAALWDAELASAFAHGERVLLVRSLGKSLSLPHLRIGLVAGPADLVDGVASALEWDVLRVGLAPQAAALAALDGPRGWLEDVHAQLAADHEAALAAFRAEPLLSLVPPRGGPFLFVSAGRPGLAGELLEAGIPAVDGAYFQAPDWARVPFGGAAAAADELAAALCRWSERAA